MPILENNRILVVDDEPQIRSGYRALLTRSFPQIASTRGGASPQPLEKSTGFEIVEAENASQAMEILLQNLSENRQFAGAFVDVRMPGEMDGLQFIQEAWKRDPDLNMVVVTAYQDRSIDELQVLLPVPFQSQWDYINKPFTSGEIIQKARQIVANWNRRDREKKYLKAIREQQDALIAQERLAAVGRLARSVGHEFGNVLQPLLSLLEITQDQVLAENYQELETSLGEMIETVTLGATICQDLLTFSRETCGSEPVKLIPISIFHSVQKALRLLRHEIKKGDIQIELKISERAKIVANDSYLLQIFINILKNSLDALSDGGSIKIESQERTGQILLQISDTGCGIASENISRVFEPLFSTKKELGNGLGLATCREIMKKLGGEISISSTSKLGPSGKSGTTVLLVFPAAQED